MPDMNDSKKNAPDRPKDEAGEIRRLAFAGAAVNILLAVAKAFGGVAASSQALIADAVHSASDLLTDAAIVIGVKYWAMPADDDHPYGHGKIEGTVTAMIGMVVAFAGVEILMGGVKSLISGDCRRPGAAAFCVALASITAKEILFRATRRAARRLKSPATEANAWHHRSDAISSIPVAVAIAAARLFPSLRWLDPVGAIVVGVFIVHVAWRIVKPAFMDLTDAGCDAESAEIKRIALAIDGVKGVHHVRARRYGGKLQTDLHIQVERDKSLVEGHAIGHAVKAALLSSALGVIDATIHVEPEDDGNDEDGAGKTP